MLKDIIAEMVSVEQKKVEDRKSRADELAKRLEKEIGDSLFGCESKMTAPSYSSSCETGIDIFLVADKRCCIRLFTISEDSMKDTTEENFLYMVKAISRGRTKLPDFIGGAQKNWYGTNPLDEHGEFRLFHHNAYPLAINTPLAR